MTEKKLIVSFLLFCCFMPITAYTQSDWEPSNGQRNGEQGEYTENNARSGHPYTIFDRNRGLEEQLAETRTKVAFINPDQHFKDIYENFVYNNTSYHAPFPENNDLRLDPAAIRAKNAAFVYLLAVTDSGVSLKNTPAHNTLKLNALRMLKEMRINTGKSSSKAEEWQWGSKKMMMMPASSVCFITCILIS